MTPNIVRGKLPFSKEITALFTGLETFGPQPTPTSLESEMILLRKALERAEHREMMQEFRRLTAAHDQGARR